MAGQGGTAEHELLKTIEKTAGKGGSSSKDDSDLASEVPLGNIVLKIKDLAENFSGERLKELFNVAKVKKILLALVIVLGVTYIIIVARGIVRLQDIPTFQPSTVEESPDTGRVDLPLQKENFYMQNLAERNIFALREPEEVEEETPEITRRSIRDRAQNLKLVGISWSEDSENRYVMMEDMNTDLTYYVREGEKFLDFRVKEVAREYVTITSNGEELDLR